MEVKKCKQCGKEFEVTHHLQVYCSVECRIEAEKNRKKKKKSRQSSLNEVARQADECGLTYGKYRVMLRMGKTYEELKAEYEVRKILQ